MKKTYEQPEVECLEFYTETIMEEDVTSIIPNT